MLESRSPTPDVDVEPSNQELQDGLRENQRLALESIKDVERDLSKQISTLVGKRERDAGELNKHTIGSIGDEIENSGLKLDRIQDDLERIEQRDEDSRDQYEVDLRDLKFELKMIQARQLDAEKKPKTSLGALEERVSDQLTDAVERLSRKQDMALNAVLRVEEYAVMLIRKALRR